MTKAATASALSPDVQAQVNARLKTIVEAGAAQAVAPGVVKDKSVVKDKQAERRRIAEETNPRARLATDDGARQVIRRERGSEMREDKGKGDAFVEAATKAIEDDDKRSVDTTPRGRSYRRGAMINDKPEKEEPEVETEAPQSDGAPREIDEAEQAEVPEITEHGEPGAPKGEMDREKAFRILRLDGFKTAALEKLSDDEAIELATHRSSVRSGVEEKLRKLAEYEKKATSVPATDKAPDAGTATPATTSRTFDIKAATTKFRAEYGDELTAMTLEEPLNALLKHVEDLITEKANALEPITRMQMEMQVRHSRDRLVRAYPELEKDEVFKRVRARAQKLDFVAYDGDIDAMLSDAARFELGGSEKTAVREAARDARRRAQPPTAARRAETTKNLSRHDLMGLIAEATEDGDQDEVQRLRRLL